jgi:hypothetical protein
MISSDMAQSQGEMFGGGGQTQPIIGPLPELPSPPPAPTSPSSSTDLEEYHAQCTTANILTCVPACNATHHGYELLATIDGTDTKFSCNLANMLYSWMGAASEGGYLGSDFASFFSAVVSGAAGAYLVMLTEDAGIATDLAIRPGQDVRIIGTPGLAAAPSWGSGGFTVEERGSLSLTSVALSASAIIGVSGGALSLAQMAVPMDLLLHALQGATASGVVWLSKVTVPDSWQDLGTLTGSVTGVADGVTLYDPPGFLTVVRRHSTGRAPSPRSLQCPLSVVSRLAHPVRLLYVTGSCGRVVREQLHTERLRGRPDELWRLHPGASAMYLLRLWLHPLPRRQWHRPDPTQHRPDPLRWRTRLPDAATRRHTRGRVTPLLLEWGHRLGRRWSRRSRALLQLRHFQFGSGAGSSKLCPVGAGLQHL